MTSLTFGIIPKDLTITKPYHMVLNQSDLTLVASIVNQGIDSHLEAVRTRQTGRNVEILDSASMRCFLRRCIESGNGDAEQLAYDIMYTLDYEWLWKNNPKLSGIGCSRNCQAVFIGWFQ